MPDELPIACALSATELPERLAGMADIGHDALIHVHTEPHRARLRFTVGADIRARLEDIVAAESECCGFLTLALVDEPDALVLTIDAPEGAELVLTEFTRAFRGDLEHAA
jgi:hypothetical protein